MGKVKPDQLAEDDSKQRKTLGWACLLSFLLLVALCWFQAQDSQFIKLPVQWMAIAVLPILLALVVDGHVTKFKGWGVDIETSRIDPEMRQLPIAPPSNSARTSLGDSDQIVPEQSPAEKLLPQERAEEYKRTRDLVLVHVYEPSQKRGQKYDIVIYLMRHIHGPTPNQVTGFQDIKEAEFCFGPSWGNAVLKVENRGEYIGVQTSAWGSFLAICRVTFTDDTQVNFFRYIDFEMAPKSKS